MGVDILTKAALLPLMAFVGFITTVSLIGFSVTRGQDSFITTEQVNLQNYVRLIAIDEMEIAIDETLAKEKVYFISDLRKSITEDNIRYYIQDYLTKSSFYTGNTGNLSVELYQGEYKKEWSVTDQKWFYLPVSSGNKIKVPAVKIKWTFPYKKANNEVIYITINEVVSLGDGFY